MWEANHVWLVFDLVIFWTALPARVRRGDDHGRAAAVARAGRDRAARRRIRLPQGTVPARRCSARLGATFAFSSLLTPFFMGTVIGAIATGQIPADASHASLAAWTSATSLLTGFLFVGACGYLAAVYLADNPANRIRRQLSLRQESRRRAFGDEDPRNRPPRRVEIRYHGRPAIPVVPGEAPGELEPALTPRA